MGVYGNLKYLGIYPLFPSDQYLLEKKTLGRVSIITHVPGTSIFRAHGGVEKHNYFGAFLLITASVTLGIAFKLRNLMFFFFFLIQFIGLFFTFTRAAYVGMLFSLFVMWIFARKTSFYFMVWIAMIILFLFSYFSPNVVETGVNRASTILNPSKQIEIQERYKAWFISLKKIMENPLGHGIGALEEFSLLDVPLTSHNDFLDIIYTRGFIAFIGYVVVYFLAIYDAFWVLKFSKDSFFKGFGMGVLAGLTGLLFTGLFQPIIQTDSTGTLVWFILAITSSFKVKK